MSVDLSYRNASTEQSTAGPYTHHYDVVIVGGGVVGLTLACGLRNTNLRVAVIESQTAHKAASRPRAYAFSPVSAKILQGLGLWDEVGPQLTHFQQVLLSDADYRKALMFRPEDGRGDAVYFSAEHTVLMKALHGAVQSAQNIDYWCEAEVQDAQSNTTLTVDCRVDGQINGQASGQYERHTFYTQLVVGADGARSGVRDRAKIRTFGWKYWQSCITAVLEPEHSHANTAYEKFWPRGPFAILPIPGNRCQVVWTAPHAEAEAMLALPEDAFMAKLRRRYGDGMGDLMMVKPPMMFPVRLMHSHRYVQPGIALIGDSAHCCHPVGGQGLNMGIRDAAALAKVLHAAHARQEPIGHIRVLKRYERWRRTENWLILAMTDLLNRLFSNRLLPLLWLRRTGFWVIGEQRLDD